jgi:hypothetical protein
MRRATSWAADALNSLASPGVQSPQQKPDPHTLPAAAEPLRVPPRSRGDGLRSCVGRGLDTPGPGERVGGQQQQHGRFFQAGLYGSRLIARSFQLPLWLPLVQAWLRELPPLLLQPSREGWRTCSKKEGFQRLMPWRRLRLLDDNPLHPFAPGADMCWHRASAGLVEHLHFGVLLDAQAKGWSRRGRRNDWMATGRRSSTFAMDLPNHSSTASWFRLLFQIW